MREYTTSVLGSCFAVGGTVAGVGVAVGATEVVASCWSEATKRGRGLESATG